MPSPRHVFLVLYAASGAAALVYEITWTRLLTLQMGQTVAAVSTVLASFMGGLAAGSWIGGRFDRRLVPGKTAGAARLQTYAALEILVALFALALPAMLAAFVPVLAWAYDEALAPTRFGIVRALLSTSLLGVPAAAMGATFPIAAAWFAASGVSENVNTLPAGRALLPLALCMRPTPQGPRSARSRRGSGCCPPLVCAGQRMSVPR